MLCSDGGCSIAGLVKDFKRKIQEISNVLNVGSNVIHAKEATACSQRLFANCGFQGR